MQRQLVPAEPTTSDDAQVELGPRRNASVAATINKAARVRHVLSDRPGERWSAIARERPAPALNIGVHIPPAEERRAHAFAGVDLEPHRREV